MNPHMWGDGTVRKLENFCKSIRATSDQRSELIARWRMQYMADREARPHRFSFRVEDNLIQYRPTSLAVHAAASVTLRPCAELLRRNSNSDQVQRTNTATPSRRSPSVRVATRRSYPMSG